MAIIQSFSVNAVTPIDPSQIVLADTSSGSDSNIASRQVLFYKVDNSLLVLAQNWAYSQSSATFSILTQDIALNIIVNWLDATNAILYTSSQIFAFKNYSEQFFYNLIQSLAAQPNMILDTNFWKNFMKLRLLLNSSEKAITTGIDIYAAQRCLDKAIYMCQQHQLFFNV